MVLWVSMGPIADGLVSMNEAVASVVLVRLLLSQCLAIDCVVPVVDAGGRFTYLHKVPVSDGSQSELC
jgi:hypothetical protein